MNERTKAFQSTRVLGVNKLGQTVIGATLGGSRYPYNDTPEKGEKIERKKDARGTDKK
jgi:hypothetical protein